jgi:hypothetical protein
MREQQEAWMELCRQASFERDGKKLFRLGGGRGIRTPGTVSRTAVFKIYGLRGFSVISDV